MASEFYDRGDELEEIMFREEVHADECGGQLRRRVNGTTGKPFFGCSRYPKCRYTRPVTEIDEEFERYRNQRLAILKRDMRP